jgi:LTXXQ motif family protein
MSSFTYPTFAAVALLASLGVANAQTTQEHEAHHPENSAPTPTAPAMPPGSAGGMDIGKMMGGHMEQMMRMMRMMRDMGSGGEMGMMPSEHVEGRIAFLKTEIGITEAQLLQWNAFADALRNSAKTMHTAMENMQEGMPTTMPAKLDAMTAMMTARVDALKTTAAATKALYAVLTDAQQKTADELVMSPMGGM